MTGETQSILVVNESLQVESLWISTPVTTQASTQKDANQETNFEIPPKSKLQISLKPWQQASWVRIVSSSSELKIHHRVQDLESYRPWPWGSSNVLTLRRGLPHVTLWISNLTSIEQSFTLTGIDNGAQYLQQGLKPFETRAWVWRGSAGALKLQARFRVSALIVDALSKESLAFEPQVSDFKENLTSPPGDSKRFMLANAKGDQSFVVDLQDPKLIAEARAQIADPTSLRPRLLVARVASLFGPRQNDMNFDLLGRWQAPWSWQVVQVYRFADFGSLDCDGSPQLLEETLVWWLQARKGLICFWNYHVKSELQSDRSP
jgi:hypothetical protein